MRVLWVSDGVVPTGFSRVAHNLIGRAPRDIEIHHLAINYYGDPHKYHYPIYPAFTGGDVYGFGRLPTLVKRLKPDVVFLFNDVPIISQYLKVLFAEQVDIPVFVYYPVDSKYLDSEWFELYPRYVQKLFVYTKFGYDETKRVFSGIEPIIIPHGVDKNIFYKLPEDVVQEARDRIGKDKFIILNANRNQPRKRIDITIRAFAEFARDKDDVALYLHMGLVDAGWDILKLAKRFGIEDKLIITNKERGVQTIPDDQLNLIYNIADVGVNTSEGEGMGLVSMEMGSLGKPQVVPNNSASAEVFADSGVVVKPTYPKIAHGTNTEFSVVDYRAVANAFQKLYENMDYYHKVATETEKQFSTNYYNWDKISEKFWQNFK